MYIYLTNTLCHTAITICALYKTVRKRITVVIMLLYTYTHFVHVSVKTL